MNWNSNFLFGIFSEKSDDASPFICVQGQRNLVTVHCTLCDQQSKNFELTLSESVLINSASAGLRQGSLQTFSTCEQPPVLLLFLKTD